RPAMIRVREVHAVERTASADRLRGPRRTAVNGEPDSPGLVPDDPAGVRVEEEEALALGLARGDVRPRLAAVRRLEHGVAPGDVPDPRAEHLDAVEVLGGAARQRGPGQPAVRRAADLAP